MASYPPPPQGQHGAGRVAGAAYPPMNNAPYPYSQPYLTSSAVLPQTTTTTSHPQPIAPAPTPGPGGPQGPPIQPCPMPPQGYQPGQPSITQQPLDGEQPTHMVRYQGRGILPSAPGKPAAPAAGSEKNQIPQKDADGKFPCPHCTKTYLHAKHLKRHLLRHTGDRPYMCVLCRNTFSRSDILKRHFITCSVRRGNPTGAGHLSHPQAHVKKNATQNAAQQKVLAEGDVNHMNGIGNMPTEGMVRRFDLIPAQDQMNNIARDQSQLFDQSYNDSEVQSNMGANINPQLANCNIQPAQSQNRMPMFPASNSADWSQTFQSGAES